MVPGWSGYVPVKLIFFNFYILNTFLYDKNLPWALSFILNKIYEIFNTITTKTLVPSLLIWSRAGPFLRTKAHDINKLCYVLQVWYVWNKNKSINGQYQFRCDRKLRITWHRENRKSWSRVRIPRHGPIFHLHIIKNYGRWRKILMCISKKRLYSTFDPNFSSMHACLVAMFCWQNLVPDFGSGLGRWSRVLFLFFRYSVVPNKSVHYWTIGFVFDMWRQYMSLPVHVGVCKQKVTD